MKKIMAVVNPDQPTDLLLKAIEIDTQSFYLKIGDKIPFPAQRASVEIT